MFPILAVPSTGDGGTLPNIQDAAQQSREAVTGAFEQAYHQIIVMAPKVAAAMVVIALGYIVARIAAKVVTTVSEKLGLQQIADRGGLADSMKQAGIKRTLPAIVGLIVFWLLMCVFLMASFNLLELQAVSDAMRDVYNYIPLVLKATVILVVGLFAATFVRRVVATSADRVGISYAPLLASACYYGLVLMTVMAAFEQVMIRFDLLNSAILIVLGGVAVAFGLAVGLGGRDVVAGILAGYYLRQRLQAGDYVTVGTLEGRIRDVGPVATILETEEHGLMNRRSVPNTKMLQEAVR